jgi:FkbM family methyltransferase
MIPIYIICFNNGYYVNKTIEQLLKKNISLDNITVLDNNSSGKETLEILSNLKCKVIRFHQNYGHLVWKREEIWSILPNYFVITDPDLRFNDNLPNNFLEVMKDISDTYKCEKVGFALEIESEKFYNSIYCNNEKINEWERRFWQNEISNDKKLKLYRAEIDTTFFLGCKKYTGGHIRIAANFTAKHLPWYPEHNCSLGYDRLKEIYENSSPVSTTGKIILNSVRKVTKLDKSFYVQLDGSHRDNFWTAHFPNWEPETFQIFNKYVKSDTFVLDIGSWIGPTVLYNSLLGANIIAVEADFGSSATLKNNIGLNSFKNIKIVEKAIYKNNEGVYFGENLFRDDGLNASTSQIVSQDSKKEKYLTESITFSELVKDIDPKNISLIKLDIEGGEEHILEEILNYCLEYSVPAYISFHLSWWSEEGKKTTFSNFSKLFNSFGHNVNEIVQNPFGSLVFSK